MPFSMLGELKRLAEEGTTVAIERGRLPAPLGNYDIVRVVSAGPRLTWAIDRLRKNDGGLIATRTDDITEVSWGVPVTEQKRIRFPKIDLKAPAHRDLVASTSMHEALDAARRHGLWMRVLTEEFDPEGVGYFYRGRVVDLNRTVVKLERWIRKRTGYSVFKVKDVTRLAILAEE